MRLELDWNFGHFFDQLGFSFALPRSLTVKHLIHHDADGPDVVLDGVDVSFERLWGHIERAPYVILLLLRLGAI